MDVKKYKRDVSFTVFGPFRVAVKELLEVFKPRYPIRIRRVKLPENLAGDCNLDKRKIFIRINKKLSDDAAIMILIHEIAHAMTFHIKDSDDHGIMWAVWYHRLYKAIADEQDEDD